MKKIHLSGSRILSALGITNAGDAGGDAGGTGGTGSVVSSAGGAGGVGSRARTDSSAGPLRQANKLLPFMKSKSDLLLIDAGSSYTRIFIDEKLALVEPTCVAVYKEGNHILSVGQEAQKLIGKTGANIEVVFPIQHGQVAHPTLFQEYLSLILKKVSTDFSIKRSVFGRSAYLNLPLNTSPVQEQVFRTSILTTDISRINFVTSLEAIYTNLENLQQDEAYLLIDIGGQLTEIGVISAGELTESTTIKWGGVSFTTTIQDQVREKHNCAIGWLTAEQVKREIGRVPSELLGTKGAKMKATVRGKDLIKQINKTITISADLFDVSFDLLVSELREAIEMFLAGLPTEISTSILDKGIFLTGGASQLTGLGIALSEAFEAQVNYSKQPELDVVSGMAKKYAKTTV